MKTLLKWLTKKEFSVMTIIGVGVVLGTIDRTGSLSITLGVMVGWAIFAVFVEVAAHG